MNSDNKFRQFLENWRRDFIDRYCKTSKKDNKERFQDAVKNCDGNQNSLDEIMIKFFDFIESNRLEEDDFYRYIKYFNETGKKLNIYFFKHDQKSLNSIYLKIKKGKNTYPYSKTAWEKYVLFMMLKIYGLYDEKFDEIFGVGPKDNREYNPATKISKLFRRILPNYLNLIEYDIKSANPTFVDLEVGITQRKESIYSILGKEKYNILINSHRGLKLTLEQVREKLTPIYGDKVQKVITDRRFDNKGQMFSDLAKYEKKYINQFIKKNKISNFVRLHDSVIICVDTPVTNSTFGSVEFVKKQFFKPEVINSKQNFYKIQNDGKVVTTPSMYMEFFLQEKFTRIYENGVDEIYLLRDTNKVLILFNFKSESIAYLKKYINEPNPEPVLNKLATDFKTIQEGFLLLDSKKLKYYQDDKDSFGLLFKNGFFSLTKDLNKIESIPLEKVNGFFKEHHTQSKDFQIKEDDVISEFEAFITMISVGKDPRKETLTEDEIKTREQFFAMIGYMCHKNKNPSFTPCIILTDTGADNLHRRGGRGKSLIFKALAFVSNLHVKGGNEFQGNYRHRFADLSVGTNIYVLDDIEASFKFDDLYTNIVNGISCELKGKSAKYLSFNETPKFMLTSNFKYIVDSSDTSTLRRFLEFKLVPYFNLEKTPKDVFGHNLLDDWDEKEWNRFYNFIFVCVAKYLTYGLEAPKYNKVDDNFLALFTNDVKINEFERIFDLITTDTNEFNVSSFLKFYNDYQNPLAKERLFSHKNIKKLVEKYIEYYNLPFKYESSTRKWKKLS
jgi:hypothetical protein